MTANRSAASFFAPLLAGGLLFLSAGCGFDGEDDDWMVGESANQPANGASAAQPQSSSRSQSSAQNASGTQTQANAGNNASTGGNNAGTGSGNNNGGSGSSGANATSTPAATGDSAGNAEGTERPGTGTASATDTSATDTSADPPAGGADSIPFSALSWSYGHFGGGRAQLSSPQLANLRCSGNTLSYSWVKGLSGWGLSNGEAGAIAAAFVQKADGSWVGGKFDWVSTSRTSRGLENVLAGYDGWSLAGVPNPCQICFVVVDVSGRRRSNVIGPATWSR